MNLDWIAKWYAGIEYLVYGGKLQKARTAHLGGVAERLNSGGRVLLVGDGDGRFFQALVQRCSSCHFVYVEHSEKMLQLAQKRVEKDLGTNKVEWIHGDILHSKCSGFDLVVSHFVLDCYEAEELEAMVKRLGESVDRGGLWLMSDFDPKASWWGEGLVGMMYGFFRVVAGLKKKKLTRPDRQIESQGYIKQEGFKIWGGFIYSDLWQKEEK